MYFPYRRQECKSRKSEGTWINRQVQPWSTNEAGQRLTEFCQETYWSQQMPLQQHRENSTRGRHRRVNTEIRLVTFFAVEDGEALYSQQKRDWELPQDQAMNSLLQNSYLN